MKPLHEELREIREEQDITIEEISEITKIRPHLLEALETGDYDILPKPYIRAFFREYAQVVGLDPERVMARLDNKVQSVRAETKPVEPEETEPSPEEPSADIETGSTPDETIATENEPAEEPVTDTIESTDTDIPVIDEPTVTGTQEDVSVPDTDETMRETTDEIVASEPEADTVDETPSELNEDTAVPEPSIAASVEDDVHEDDGNVVDTAPADDEQPAPEPESEQSPAEIESTETGKASRKKRRRGKRKGSRASGKQPDPLAQADVPARLETLHENPDMDNESAPATESETPTTDTPVDGNEPISADPGNSSASNLLEAPQSDAGQATDTTENVPPEQATEAPDAEPQANLPEETPAPLEKKQRIEIEEPQSNTLFFIMFFVLIVLAAVAIFWMNSGG